MGVAAFAAVRSAGVTTTVAALSAMWPAGRRLLLAEADPAGGTLAAFWGQPANPGLVSLAAASRRGSEPELVWGHVRTTPYGAALLAGPPAAEQARAALGMAGDLLAGLGRLDEDVLVDCGRLDPASQAESLFAGADAAVLVARPQLADLHHLADWLPRHRPAGPAFGVVLVGPAAFASADIVHTLEVEVWGQLPHDPAGVAALDAGPGRPWFRCALSRDARPLAEALAGRLTVTADVGQSAYPEAGEHHRPSPPAPGTEPVLAATSDTQMPTAVGPTRPGPGR